jgi:hypothetical protein
MRGSHDEGGSVGQAAKQWKRGSDEPSSEKTLRGREVCYGKSTRDYNQLYNIGRPHAHLFIQKASPTVHLAYSRTAIPLSSDSPKPFVFPQRARASRTDAPAASEYMSNG